MIWHSTQHFGCGKARSRCGKVIAVAYYEPKGNIEGQFHENIFPPVKDHDTGNGNGDFSESDENNETNYCDNNLIVILYINVINVIVLLILVIVVL